MYGGIKFLTILIVYFLLSEIAFAEKNQQCVPSSCGHIHNISYPFRLKTDPKHCGREDYELSCEGNHTILSHSDENEVEWYYYVVQAINYDNSTIRIVDPGIREHVLCSLPQHWRPADYLYPMSFTTWKSKPGDYSTPLTKTITIFSCPFAINSPVVSVEITNCLNRSYAFNTSSSDLFRRHTYATMSKFLLSDLRIGCTVDLVSSTSWHTEDANANISISDLHNALVYGFELSWFYKVYCDICPRLFRCEGENSRDVRCMEDTGCTNYNNRYFTIECGKNTPNAC